jgi:hypothetical protein
MRRIIYTFFLSCVITCGIAQTEWAPVGAKWIYDNYSGAQPVITVIESVKDTTILNKQCKVLKPYEIDNNEDSTGHYYYDTLYCPLQYLHYDSSIVYLYDKILNSFFILYNFNAIKGDTITVKEDSLFSGYCPDNDISSNSLFQYKVDSISDTIINGINLRTQFTNATQNAAWFFNSSNLDQNYPIIERIGSLKYFFGEPAMVIMEGPVCCLRCYNDSNIFYHSPTWTDTLDCAYPIITNIKETNNTGNNIAVYPNPTINTLTIESPQPAVIEITNIQDQLIKKLAATGNKTNIDVTTLPAGVYLIKLFTEKGAEVRKFVKE